jgi:F-type H+-transporting ATPase subunit alpha
LVVGDRQTGKTSIGLDTILNQTGLGTLCLLSALGQKATPALGTCLAIASRDAFGFLTISMASASASAVSQFLSTYATSSMSLLLRQPPGREAFPGEIFFVHSRLLNDEHDQHHRWANLPFGRFILGQLSASSGCWAFGDKSW